MRDPFRPNHRSQMMREAQIGLSVLAILLTLFAYVAFNRIMGHGNYLPDHVRNAPVAQMVWPNGGPDSGPGTSPTDANRLNVPPVRLTSVPEREISVTDSIERGGLSPKSLFQSSGISQASYEQGESESDQDTNFDSQAFSSVNSFTSTNRRNERPAKTQPEEAATYTVDQPVVRSSSGLEPELKSNDFGNSFPPNKVAPQSTPTKSQFEPTQQDDPFNFKPSSTPNRVDEQVNVSATTAEALQATGEQVSDEARSVFVNELRSGDEPFNDSALNSEPRDVVKFQGPTQSFASVDANPMKSMRLEPVNQSTESFMPRSSGVAVKQGNPSFEPVHQNDGSGSSVKQFLRFGSDEALPAMKAATPNLSQFTSSSDGREFPVKPASAVTDEDPETFQNRADSGSPKHTLGQNEYLVEYGDSFWSIASKSYDDGRYFRALFQYNQPVVVKFENLNAGMVISIPPKSDLQKLWPDLCPVQNSTHGAQQNQGVRPASERIYTTEAGDTLFDIARQRLGQASRYLELFKLNELRLSSDVTHLTPLKAGIKLVLPLE